MTPRGFEPPTPGLKVQYSDQAELRGHYKKPGKILEKNAFKKLTLFYD